jgi:hypothetical protein
MIVRVCDCRKFILLSEAETPIRYDRRPEPVGTSTQATPRSRDGGAEMNEGALGAGEFVAGVYFGDRPSHRGTGNLMTAELMLCGSHVPHGRGRGEARELLEEAGCGMGGRRPVVN